MLDVRPGITDLASIVFADEGEILAGSARSRPALQPDHPALEEPGWRCFMSITRRCASMCVFVFWTALALVSRRRALDAVRAHPARWEADPLLIADGARREPLLALSAAGSDTSRREISDVRRQMSTQACAHRQLTRLTMNRRRGYAIWCTCCWPPSALVASFLLRFEFSLARAVPAHAAGGAAGAGGGQARRVSRLRSARSGLALCGILRPGAHGRWPTCRVRSLAAAVALRLAIGSAFPRSIHVLDFLLCLAFMTAARAAARCSVERHRRPAPGVRVRTVLIYGAGKAGVTVLSEIRAHPGSAIARPGFSTTILAKRGMRHPRRARPRFGRGALAGLAAQAGASRRS